MRTVQAKSTRLQKTGHKQVRPPEITLAVEQALQRASPLEPLFGVFTARRVRLAAGASDRHKPVSTEIFGPSKTFGPEGRSEVFKATRAKMLGDKRDGEVWCNTSGAQRQPGGWVARGQIPKQREAGNPALWRLESHDE